MKPVLVLAKVVSFLLMINLFLICDCRPDPRGGGGHGGAFGGGHAGVGHGGFGHGGFGHGGFGHGHGGFGHGGFGHGPYGGGGFIIPPSFFQQRHRNYRRQRIGAFGFGLGS